jgi:ArsR family metal-binding transcriptional regulator
MPYLDAVSLIKTIPCLAEPGKVIVVGSPSQPLSDVIPYMATLPGVISYNPATCALTFRRKPGFITLESQKIYITQVKDSSEGLILLEAVKDAINVVWEKREELSAVTVRKRAPQHLDVWELLPRTNCKQCGEPTCLAFAVGLIMQKRQLEECRPLQDDPYLSDRYSTLQAMLF